MGAVLLQERRCALAFAKLSDLETRLGRTLTDIEQSQAIALLDDASEIIALAVGKTAAEITSPPPIFPGMSVTLALRAFVNPAGLSSQSETLGAHSYSETYRRDTSNPMELSDVEARTIRRAYYGQNVAAPKMEPRVLMDLLEAEGYGS